MDNIDFARLADDELLGVVSRLAGHERLATARLVAALGEVDARRLYLAQGCSSLFVYCTRVLHLSEHAAYARIEAARASRRFPGLLTMLESGDLTLTTVCLLAPHLTEANRREVTSRARHRTKREVEEIVASLRPHPDVPARVRKLPEAAGSASPSIPVVQPSTPTSVATTTSSRATVARPAAIEALAPERFKLQLTIGRATRDKLDRAKALMRHAVPSGDLSAIVDRALDLLLADLERSKCAAVGRPRPAGQPDNRSRHVPAAVRRAVWQRDGGRCAFVGAHGRCDEAGFLEFHHLRPFDAGGEATADNISLRCRAHNQYQADLFFGEPFIVREWPAVYSVRTE